MDEFRISNYLKYPINKNDISTNLQVKFAKEWAEDAMRTIIYPVDTLRELEELWMNYELMPVDDRRESDDKSNEIFGFPNQYHYEKLKSEFLKDDIESINLEDIDESTEFDSGITYSPIDVENALDWSRRSGYPIIVPTSNLKDLEDLWNNFLSYPGPIRGFSNDESISFFGMNNEKHYYYLKSEFLKQDIEKPEIIQEMFIPDPINLHSTFAMNENVSTVDRAKDLLTILARKNENYEESLIQNIVDKSTTEYKASNQNLRYNVVSGEDLPFFTPEEMIDAGVNQSNPENNFYGCEPVSNVIAEDGEWFNNYYNACIGLPNLNNQLDWKNSVANLELKMKTVSDKEPYKQALLNIGWPPEAEFSPENRVTATKRLKNKLASRSGSAQFVDLTGMDATDSIDESITSGLLKPVYIVLEEGKTLMSAAIKKVTNSTYTHAAISFNPNMEEMYSYGIEGSEKGLVGGFIKENVKDKDPDRHMAIYAIFLKEEDWNKLKNTIDDFVANIKKTSYSYINLIVSHIFKIPLNMNKKMVCSQFVDRVLKLTDIDISKKNSSLVSPADFEKYAKENKKIYILFDDIVSKFKGSRIKNLSSRLSKKADPIKESILWTDPVGIVFEMINNINSLEALQELSTKIELDSVDKRVKKVYETMIEPCLVAEEYFTEAKDFPVQFDKDGNLFIKNMKKKERDYEGEYSKSHKLLRQYEKSNNIDGMKYELCKLWLMNSLIEAKAHGSPKTYKTGVEVKEDANARAKILNDFNYYLGIVLKEDPKFNFQEYYNDSPFNDAMTKINRDTIIWSGRMLKTLIHSL